MHVKRGQTFFHLVNRFVADTYTQSASGVIVFSGETLRITVTATEYIDKLVDKSLIKIYAIANVKETRQTWSEEDDFQLQKPKLNIKVLNSRQV